MAPKKKAQKMALADFFNDEATGGSWADELGDLPTAPAPKDPNAGPRRGEAGYLDSMPDRSSRPGFSGPPREEIPIPSAPPYTAFVGNLTFETDEAALREFFGDCKPVSARIMKNPQGEAKGFGYVEFETVDGLKEALARSESNLGGRTIRVSVAEPPSSRKDFGPSAADEASQWRRATPLPAREAAAPPARRGGSYSDSPAGGAGVERDWGAARGARFTPAPPTPLGGGLRRDSSGPGREREFREPREPSQADEAGQWRSARPLVEAVAAPSGGPGGARRDAPPHVAGGGQSSPGLADTEQTWSRGTKLRTPVTSEPARSGTASPAGEDRDWRSSRATSAVPSTDGDNSPRQAPAAPAERRKLALAPRSVPATPSSATSPDSTTAAPSSGKSIFGAAKPIDTAAREREAAAKMAARDAERKKAREEEAKCEEDKAKKLSDDRARAIKEAQDKAMAAVTGRPVPKARQTSTGAQGAGAAAKKRGPGQVGEDGFEQVAGKGARAPAQERPGQGSRKESTTRTGFSFAAAAGGIAGQDEDDEGKDGVEDVTNGVKEVAV